MNLNQQELLLPLTLALIDQKFASTYSKKAKLKLDNKNQLHTH